MLALYRALTDVGLPLIRLALARRMRRGREDTARFPERMGIASLPSPKEFWCGSMPQAWVNPCRS